MAHHTSDGPFRREPSKEQKELQKKLVKMFENRTAASDMQPGSSAAFKKMAQNIGALGEFPEGQLSPNDEGAIRFRIGAQDGKIIVDFGTPVHSLGLDPDDAEAIAQSLLEKARIARNQRK